LAESDNSCILVTRFDKVLYLFISHQGKKGVLRETGFGKKAGEGYFVTLDTKSKNNSLNQVCVHQTRHNTNKKACEVQAEEFGWCNHQIPWLVNQQQRILGVRLFNCK